MGTVLKLILTAATIVAAITGIRAQGLISFPPNASPDLIEYVLIMMPIERSASLAYWAGVCGLRSEAYFETFKIGRLMVSQKEASRLHLSPAEVASADANALKVLRDEAIRAGEAGPADLQQTCRRLANSPELDQLDEVQRKLTGNRR